MYVSEDYNEVNFLDLTLHCRERRGKAGSLEEHAQDRTGRKHWRFVVPISHLPLPLSFLPCHSLRLHFCCHHFSLSRLFSLFFLSPFNIHLPPSQFPSFCFSYFHIFFFPSSQYLRSPFPLLPASIVPATLLPSSPHAPEVVYLSSLERNGEVNYSIVGERNEEVFLEVQQA